MAGRRPHPFGVLLLLLTSLPFAARADGPSAQVNLSTRVRTEAPNPPTRIVIRPGVPIRPNLPAPPPPIVAPPVVAKPVIPSETRVPPVGVRVPSVTLGPPSPVSGEDASPTGRVAPSSALAGVAARDIVANQVIAAVPADQAARTIAGDYGLSVDDEAVIGALGVRLVAFTMVRSRSLGDLIDQLGLDPRVRAAQPNFRYRTSASITGYPHTRTRLESARALASGAGVTVAIIDTRVANLPTLSGQVSERVSLAGSANAWRHGTAVAGLIAEVAPAVQLISIEAFEEDAGNPDSGTATTIVLARAIEAALARNPAVLNLSVAGPRDPLIGRMVRQAVARGMVVVAAAGNDGPEAPPRYPAAYDGVVAVTAVDSHDQPYPAAARGPHIALAAPGVDVAVELPGGRVGYVSGTSVAAAQVAGVAALLRERAPRLGSAEARKILMETATALPGGPGMVNAFAAVSRVSALTRR